MILYILDIEQFKESEYGKRVSKQKVHHQAGQYLLRRALGEETYVRAEFAVGEHGKPYIVDSFMHYNISHSGRYVVLVIAQNEVGVDIQEKKAVRAKNLAIRFFDDKERLAVCACADEKSQEELFYKIWCRKEAYGKCLGVGLNEDVLHTNVLSASLENHEFHDLDMVEGYQLCICSRKGEHIEKIIRVFKGL